MANLVSRMAPMNIRYLHDANNCDDATLDQSGYYRGFPCPHNHTIRDKEHHWCYYCVQKIWKNNCGIDVNFLNYNYKHKLIKLWNRIEIGAIDECWYIKGPKKRICLPSYRSGYSKQLSENTSIHKATYISAWGDVGSCFVTHACGNKHCVNPVHLLSSWNREYPPQRISPLILEFDPQKLMRFANAEKQNKTEELASSTLRSTITHPLEALPEPEYHFDEPEKEPDLDDENLPHLQ